MRPIKFRLRIDNKIVGYEKWYSGDMVEFEAKPLWLYSKYGEYWNPNYIHHFHKDEFIGLKDKNGKEIYGGDICRCIHSEQNGKNQFEKIEQVYTRPGGFSLFGKPMQDFSYESNNRLTAFNWKTDRSINIPEFYYKIYDIEVIGNIWEGTPDITRRESGRE